MPESGAPKTYAENTKEQYEALGRFVEAFEAMINEVRESTAALIERDGRHRLIVEIVLHHQALTAKPIFEIFRAIVMEIVDETIAAEKRKEKGIIELEPPIVVDIADNPLHFTSSDREIFLAVMNTIAQEYNDLVNTRNNLLHATWFIGFSAQDDPTSSEFYARKYSTTKEGLRQIELPKNAAQLQKLSQRCDDTRTWIGNLHSCLGGPSNIRLRFERQGKEWLLVIQPGHTMTLPRKQLGPCLSTREGQDFPNQSTHSHNKHALPPRSYRA
jgi:hypothetical protein